MEESARANVCLVQSGEKRREICRAIVPALENVYIWDARLGEKVLEEKLLKLLNNVRFSTI